MEFFGVGPGELLLILVLALIVFGPGKLPEIGSAVGKGIREFRRTTSEVTQELTKSMEVDARELPRPVSLTCPSCGASNLAGNKFCGRCGAALFSSPSVQTQPVAQAHTAVPIPVREDETHNSTGAIDQSDERIDQGPHPASS